MDGPEVLRIVDAIHIDKNIDQEIVFEGIEQAILSAAKKHFGDEKVIEVDIDRKSGQPSVTVGNEALRPDEIGELIGRIGAQTAKQVMIQKIREAERDAVFDEYADLESQIVTGSITRIDHGTITVNLGKVEAILPRGEQIPGESHRSGERIRAVVMEVAKAGSRVKIILSRRHTDFVRRLFELEIPEVNDHVIEVRSIAREAGHRSKVAVSCFDSKIDSVGACVGVRGSRIKNIIDELGGERIDIVKWNDSLQVLVPNALQPAEVEDVILCPMLGKVIVLVRDDQLSLAIGKKGQNVRLASKLVGWDISVMTQDKLDEQIDFSVTAFTAVPQISDELAEKLIEEGFFTFDDLSVIEPDFLRELSGLSEEECDEIIAYADEESLRLEEQERADARQERSKKQQPPRREPAVSDETVAAVAPAEELEESAPDEELSAEDLEPHPVGHFDSDQGETVTYVTEEDNAIEASVTSQDGIEEADGTEDEVSELDAEQEKPSSETTSSETSS